MIYFTSDLHLGHEAVICMQNRPFANADEMNRVLIENYNSVVQKEDKVYLIGDICFRIGVEKANLPNAVSDAFMAKKSLWQHYAAWTYSFG